MRVLRFLTAGESHGFALTAIVEGLPAGLRVDAGAINDFLARRQKGYGRGGRMDIERDEVQIRGGVRHGRTLGSPIAMVIRNRDWDNWAQEMSVAPMPEGWASSRAVRVPRPGHADLAGGLKYRHRDLRNVLERASARETAARVVVGALCRTLLRVVGIEVASMVTAIGGARWEPPEQWTDSLIERASTSDVSCPDEGVAERMRESIDAARQAGDTVGGTFQVRATGVMPGLGSHAHWDRRLDARLGAAIMSIPAIKGMQIGLGFEAAGARGSQVHDPIVKTDGPWGPGRTSNNAGGIEGGITNGEPIVIEAAMKPIPTLTTPLDSVDLDEFAATEAHAERSDVCAVPAAAVVAEGVVCIELARAVLEKFGGDHIDDITTAIEAYRRDVARIWTDGEG